MIFDKSHDAFHFLLFPIQLVVYVSAITLVVVGTCVNKIWNRNLSEDSPDVLTEAVHEPKEETESRP